MQNTPNFSDRIQKADQQIGEALRAIQADQDVSSQTSTCVQEFYDKSHDIVGSMSGISNDELRSRIIELEQLADNAKDAARDDSNIPPDHRQMIIDAHNTVSNLKHDLQ